MAYQEALEAAGATVFAFGQFGSYQGDWWAKTDKGWVNGGYGSCSGCDAFEAEFGYQEDRCEEHKWEPEVPCEECDKAKVAYQQRLADFGRGYLDGAMTQAEAEEQASKNLEWDSDAPEMLAFIKSHA